MNGEAVLGAASALCCLVVAPLVAFWLVVGLVAWWTDRPTRYRGRR